MSLYAPSWSGGLAPNGCNVHHSCTRGSIAGDTRTSPGTACPNKRTGSASVSPMASTRTMGALAGISTSSSPPMER
jgi:hypothetical protein